MQKVKQSRKGFGTAYARDKTIFSAVPKQQLR